MASAVAVLLLDDGELDDVQQILEGLGVSYGRVRGEAIASETPPPSDLLVATPRRIDAIQRSAKGDPAVSFLRIGVVEEDSPTLRARLRKIGFDYLVRRPVHPEALRLLLLHCLYQGEERRREGRIPVGFDISFRTGLLPRRATLTDLSANGCRLLSPYALEPGMRIRVQIPTELGASEPLSLRGRILRIHLEEHLEGDGLYSIAVLFENPTPEARRELEAIVRERANGRITWGSDDREAQKVDVRLARSLGVDGEASGESAPERRRSRRGSYDRRVPAFGDPALRVLVGRDLSAGGMRIERFPALALGDRLHLAIYGEAREEPVLVWATVSRDDEEEGMGLVFDAVEPPVAEKLERLVANLPAVESLQDQEVGAMGTVVSKILADPAPRPPP